MLYIYYLYNNVFINLDYFIVGLFVIVVFERLFLFLFEDV